MTETTEPLNKPRKLTPLQMHRKVELMRRGITLADIAREVDVSRSAVTQVVLDQIRSAEIEAAIAKHLGEPVEQLFPAKQTVAA
jgi:transcriptional regulator with XRE-family HTH domain